MTCYIIFTSCKISYKLLIKIVCWCFDLERKENMDGTNMIVMRDCEKDKVRDSELRKMWHKWNTYECYEAKLKATNWQRTEQTLE